MRARSLVDASDLLVDVRRARRHELAHRLDVDRRLGGLVRVGAVDRGERGFIDAILLQCDRAAVQVRLPNGVLRERRELGAVSIGVVEPRAPAASSRSKSVDRARTRSTKQKVLQPVWAGGSI